ncbi:hypothetical protein ANANG_G00095960 [Anguilla anguilla]|uniref:Uncharacterized protein n=1 Tax=Anguilla anguilla TaxID=7936 RepID=A0A9D3S2U3_ANGAN|nr:hypothetical protein ANANG_G00095960 [Anguilla anguilla]
MVLCFLIHTLCPVAGLPPGGSRVLFSRVFGPEDAALDGPGPELGPEERRLLQKEKLAVVARQVRSACALQREAAGRPVVEAVQGRSRRPCRRRRAGSCAWGGDPFPGAACCGWRCRRWASRWCATPREPAAGGELPARPGADLPGEPAHAGARQRGGSEERPHRGSAPPAPPPRPAPLPQPPFRPDPGQGPGCLHGQMRPLPQALDRAERAAIGGSPCCACSAFRA